MKSEIKTNFFEVFISLDILVMYAFQIIQKESLKK